MLMKLSYSENRIHQLHQFDPAIIKNVTGLTSYNMGWPGMFFIQYEGLLNEYMDYEKKCKCIVIACDFDNLGRNKLITRPDLFWAYIWNNNVYSSLNNIDYKETFHARYLPGYKLTLLNKLGIPSEKLGDSTGQFQNLSSL